MTIGRVKKILENQDDCMKQDANKNPHKRLV